MKDFDINKLTDDSDFQVDDLLPTWEDVENFFRHRENLPDKKDDDAHLDREMPF